MYQKILVAVDGSPSSKRAVQEAIRIAKLTHAHVRNIYVLDLSPVFPYTVYYDLARMEESFTRHGRAWLDEEKRALAESGIDSDSEIVKTEDMTEDVATCLKRYVAAYQPDLVIMGTHGRHGVRRAFLGSVAERFLRLSTCPVLLVRDENYEPEKSYVPAGSPAK
jgi:nucleotide-binding universal stress UspA family protein